MSFFAQAESYDRFMGRFSSPLAPRFADFAGVAPGQRVLDVGCGTGALTAELVARAGAAAVTAIDPSAPFVDAARERQPDVDVRHGSAEDLPFADGEFDAALAQLVVHFMADPVAGIAEMRRVTRAGGVVAACVWDHGGRTGPLGTFWRVARTLDPDADDESERPGTRRGQLVALLHRAGLVDVEESILSVAVEHASFDAWWEPFTLGVGPAGTYVAQLDESRRSELRDRCRAELGDGPFVVTARAWAARGRA